MRISIAFGKTAWARHIGDVGEQPLLPPEIDDILKAKCQVWPDKTVEETHLLALIPKEVNGKPLTLDYLERLIEGPNEKPTERNLTGFLLWDIFAFFFDAAADARKRVVNRQAEVFQMKNYLNCGQVAVEHSYWMLLTKSGLPKTRGLAASIWPLVNGKMVASRGMADVLEAMPEYHGYKVPRMLEAVIGLFQEYTRRKVFLYNTWSEEKGGRFPVFCEENCVKAPIAVWHIAHPKVLQIIMVSAVLYNNESFCTDECCFAGVRRL